MPSLYTLWYPSYCTTLVVYDCTRVMNFPVLCINYTV